VTLIREAKVDLVVKEQPLQIKRTVPNRGYTVKQIEMMPFFTKEEEDEVDDDGLVKRERCYLCKWYIEKGNYLLKLECGHRLHKKCLEVWFCQNNTCPIC